MGLELLTQVEPVRIAPGDGRACPLESFHFGVLVGLGFIGFRVSGFGLRV